MMRIDALTRAAVAVDASSIHCRVVKDGVVTAGAAYHTVASESRIGRVVTIRVRAGERYVVGEFHQPAAFRVSAGDEIGATGRVLSHVGILDRG